MKNLNKSLSLIVTMTAVMASSLPAQAVNLKFTYDPGITESEQVAAELAANIWQQYLGDSATINIHLKKGSASKLPSGTLAGAIPAFNSYSYANVYNALKSDRTTTNNSINDTDDEIAVANLLAPTASSVMRNNQEGFYWQLNEVSLTRANAKALNLISSTSTALDGVIVFNDLSNTGFSWQNNYLSSSVGTNRFDLTSVLVHEIGHILGFVSGIDGVNDNNSADPDARNKYITSFDLFRESSHTTDQELQGLIETSYGSNAYFSLNGGNTAIANLSKGEDIDLGFAMNEMQIIMGTGVTYQSDGYQGSHWRRGSDGSVLGIMDPALPTNTRRGVTNLDLRALDAIGWNRTSSSFSSLSSSQLSNLQTQATTTAANKGTGTRITPINNMFNQSRWGGTTTSTTLNQGQDLVDYLAQEGLFQVNNGTMWSVITEEPEKVPEPSAAVGLLGLGLFGLRLRKKKKGNAFPTHKCGGFGE